MRVNYACKKLNLTLSINVKKIKIFASFVYYAWKIIDREIPVRYVITRNDEIIKSFSIAKLKLVSQYDHKIGYSDVVCY